MLTPIVFADRVKDTSTTTGTGNFTLSGSAPTGFQTFDAALGHAGNYFYYVIDGGAEWEVGIGHLSASTTLVRDVVLASSNSGSAVSFSAGTKNVFCDLAAGGIPQTIALATDTTYNNTSAYANTGLNLPVVAGGVYKVDIFLIASLHGTTPKFDFNGGTATATQFQGVWEYQADGFALSSVTSIVTALSTSSNPNSGGTFKYIYRFTGILTVNAAGTFIMRSAQGSAAANDTTLLAGSTMILTRIG
jgi:hypothetical protein